MAGFDVASNEHLIRANLWSAQLKEVLEDHLLGLNHVDWLTEFTDGDTWNIPSVGQAEVLDYEENMPIRYTAMDTGNFTFTITEYKQSGTYITDKMKQDSYYTARLVASFVPKQARALAVSMETDLLAVGPLAQTAANTNSINGAFHRWVGSGTNETIAPEDFAKAKMSLIKANVPTTGLIAIVDPSVGFKLETMPNIVNISNNPMWEGVINTGMLTGTRFLKNVYGFDVYVSDHLRTNTTTEAIGGITAAAGVNNLFFSAASDVLPIVGNIRQAARVESQRNMDMQRDEYVTTCRYGFKLFRPENMVVVVTDTDQVF